MYFLFCTVRSSYGWILRVEYNPLYTDAPPLLHEASLKRSLLMKYGFVVYHLV